MKKNIIAFLFLLTLFHLGNAQTYKFGAFANLHKSSIVGIHDFSRGKLGGGVGVFANIGLVENDVWDSAWLYLDPQIEFSMQGENADARAGWQTFDHWYVASQVYLKYFFHKGNLKRDIFIFAGPRIEYLVRQERKGPPSPPVFEEQEQRINKFGYGVSFGTGLKISQQLEGTIRYDWGFGKVYPDYTRYHTYNRLLSLGINYYFTSNW